MPCTPHLTQHIHHNKLNNALYLNLMHHFIKVPIQWEVDSIIFVLDAQMILKLMLIW
jgi:hypothetical protein